MMSDFTDHIPQATTDPDDTAILLCSCGWESHGGGGGDWWDHLETTLAPSPSAAGALGAALRDVPTVKGLTVRLGRFNGAWWDRFGTEVHAAVVKLGWDLVPRGELEKLRAENALWVPNVADPDRPRPDLGRNGVEEVIEDMFEASWRRRHPQGTGIAPLPLPNTSLMGPKP